MKNYANGRLTSEEACRVVSNIIRGNAVPLPKPQRSKIFDYHCHQLSLAFQRSKGASSYGDASERLIHAVPLQTRLFDELSHRDWKLIPFLLRISRFHQQWQATPESWLIGPGDQRHRNQTNCGLARRHPEVYMQLASLIRHLFGRYEMPDFWDAVWFQEHCAIDYRMIEWFVHVATGENLRKADHLPFHLTKAAAHHMNEAPAHADLLEAMRWGQLRAMGATRELVKSVLKTPAAVDFANDAFWLPLFTLMIREPDFHASVAPALIDYVIHRRSMLKDGVRFRIQRRKLSALLREMAAFYRKHRELENVEPAPALPPRRTARRRRIVTWQPLDGIEALDETSECRGKMLRWRTFELRRSYLLEIESRKMKHCVATYVSDCRNRLSSIWSLRSFLGEEQRWEATIEVDPREKAIVQVRAFQNSDPSEAAWEQIERWAKLNDLEMAV